MSTTMRSKHNALTPCVYDLNIFKRELEQADGSYEHAGPWYIHVYECNGGSSDEVTIPIELTAEESNNLIENDPYFQDHEPDLWYGLEGFMFEKWNDISDRLKMILEGLPKYREEVLF